MIWPEGLGYANKEDEIKATPETTYRNDSVTKLFTGIAEMSKSMA